MSKTRKPEKMRHSSRHQSVGAWLVLGLGLVPALAGCSATSPNHVGDPLYGEYYPKGPNGQPLPPPNTGPAKTTSAVPPYPANNSASSTAAIAGIGSQPGARPLAINEKSGPSWTLTNTTNPGTVPAGSGAPIVQPIPRDTAAPASSPFGAPNAAAGVPNPGGTIIAAGSWSSGTPTPASGGPVPPLGMTTTDGLQGTLQGKGAVGLQQENVLEGVRVSCYVPQRSNPANLRYLETTARDYPTALQALLQQVDQ